MKKHLLVLLAAATLISCRPALQHGRWERDTYDALSGLLSNPDNKGGYAVFDCDNTTIIHDVTHTLMVYQIENLCFSLAPEHLFLDGLGVVDFPLDGLELTAREMGQKLSDEYYSLKEMYCDSLYRDFRARFLAFYTAIGKNYDYGTLCLWEPSLAAGFEAEELQALGRRSLSHWLSQGRAWDEEWTSPDGRFFGMAHKGLVITPEMRDLYRSLSRAGIVPYICSASPEWLVELLACDPKYGFSLPPEQVFGVRFQENEDGSWHYSADYPQPFKEGKVRCIDRYIAPLHCGGEPLMVAGDSEGDLAMLTAYPQMQLGLVINWNKGGKIGELACRNDGRYVSQHFKKD